MEYSLVFVVWLRALLPLFIVAITFYVLIIKPLEKHHHARRFIATLCPGVRIVTREGRNGVIVIVLQASVIIEFDDGTKAEVLKQNLHGEV